MRAIDTNVVVRFLANDDEAQATRARRLIAAGDIFVATTVLLESEWVLRTAYGLSNDRVVQALRRLAGLRGVTLEDPALAARALNLAEQGLDFADALHLGRAQGCTAFMSFDRKLA
ncbi:MAG TPA: type II toxin-antitoxin system VapC family toxin, partial [Allosphingosinicella sp.]|nr:type II toxin-antitoxin system VapC family toxin [Allosphingosinicella sp.]